jgi:outer membrane biosynthesis protein TonB
MSDTSAFGFGQFVPGFDFLQNLSQTASKASPAAGAIPGMPSWVAPTLNVEEIDKRIQELKAVQFWLEQNGTALKATIQALEVQKMTLTTLQGMNVSMADLAKAFTAKPPEAPAASAQPEPEAAPEPTPEPEVAASPEPEAQPKSKAQSKGAADKPAVDPMAWWGSLTQQFQNIAGAAMKDVAAEAMKAQAAAKAASKASAPVGAKAAPKSAKSSARTAKAASKKAPAKKAARKTPASKSPARQRPAA